MDKKLIIIILFVIILVSLVLFVFINIEESEFTEVKQTYKAFNLNGNFDMVNNNDMQSMNKIYSKKVSTYEEYQNVKEMWNNIIDMNEEDFNSSFMLIAVIENTSMIGLTLGDLYADENTLYIGLKKHDSETAYDIKETGISIIIPNNLDRDKIETYRTIDKKYNINNIFSDIKSIPLDYSIEQAINDKCFVIPNDIKTYNNEQIYDFMAKANNKEDATIRIARYINPGNKLVYDVVKYVGEYDEFLVCRKGEWSAYNGEWDSYNYYEYSTIIERKVEDDGITMYILTAENEEDFHMCATYSEEYYRERGLYNYLQ